MENTEYRPDDDVKSDAESEGNFKDLKDERAFEDAKYTANTHDHDHDHEELECDPELLSDIPDEADEIELTHSRLRSLRGLDLSRFQSTLLRICFRQNLLHSLILTPKPDDPPDRRVAPLECLTNLDELDLYDNRLSKITGIRGLCNLRILDLSFNLLHKIPPLDSPDSLSQYPKLETLYLVQNSIKKITGLDGLAKSLRSLELGGNRIREISGLNALENLEELWLGKNKISTLKGLVTLKKLRILSIQSNRLTKIEGLESLENLEELYISHNALSDLSGLDKNKKLRVLDIGANRITSIDGVQNMSELEEFWANDNQIQKQPDPLVLLESLKKLDTVYLEGNPVQKDFGVGYRRKMILALPQITQLDAIVIRAS